MATILPYAFIQEFDNNGSPLAGGLIYTYDAGTTTPKATYTDSGGGTANANPVVLDVNGRADIWLGEGSYKLVLKDSAGTTIKTVDNIIGQAANAFGGTYRTITTNTSVNASYANNVLECTSAVTLSLLDVSTAGEGFLFTVKNTSGGNVTIDPDASEQIDGVSALTIPDDRSALIVCTGTAWSSLFLISGTMADQNANNVNITGGSITGITDLAIADGGTGASTASAAFDNLKQAASATATGVVELATDAEFVTGTDTARAVTPANVRNGIGFSKVFTSTDQTITAAGSLTIAHGLATTPLFVQCFLVCQTGELGYTAGDIVVVSNHLQNAGGSGVSRGQSIVPDGTNLNIRYANNANTYDMINKTTGAVASITNANWRLRIRAWG